MSLYELLTLLAACLALIISLIVWFGQRRLQEESNRLQRIMADQSQKQITQMEAEDEQRRQAHLILSLEEHGRDHRLLITNHGPAIARQVQVQSLGTAVEDQLLIEEEVASKFPLDTLMPGSSSSLTACIYMGSPMVFRIRVTWQDGRGILMSEERKVAM